MKGREKSTEAERQRLARLLGALHLLPCAGETWDEAGRLGFQLRRRGLVVPFTDVLIAAVALGSGAVLLHRDRHYDLMVSHLPLRLESHLPL